MRKRTSTLLSSVALAALFSAAPALAQNNQFENQGTSPQQGEYGPNPGMPVQGYGGGTGNGSGYQEEPYPYNNSQTYNPYANNAEINGQSPYWSYRNQQPYYRGYTQPTQYSPYIPRPQSYDHPWINGAPTQPYGQSSYRPQPPQQYATAPVGLTMPCELATSISTQAAKAGDFIQANIMGAIHLQGWNYIPGGSKLTGEIVEAEPGRMLGRAGSLGVKFDHLTLPSGQSIPIMAHVVGKIGKYNEKDGVYKGEGWGTKLTNLIARGAIGAGGGALFGTALGEISSGGRLGLYSWTGAGFGGGVGVLDALMARRGHNVIINAGAPMQVQLDQSVQIPVSTGTGV